METKIYTPAELNAFKFVSHEGQFDNTGTSYIGSVMVALVNKTPLSKIPVEKLLHVQKAVNEGICVSKGCAALMGYAYDFTPFLKRYVVSQYGRWYEYYGFNKTLLRKMIYGAIQEIIEIPEKK